MSGPAETVTAAYGLRFEGLGSPEALRLHDVADWPMVCVRHELGGSEPRPQGRVTEDTATILNPAAVLLVDRASSSLTTRSAAPVPPADLIHPGLWPAAAVFARWRRAETLHAGAFAPPGLRAAWAVMADSGGGKSSFLAALALSGAEVLVDDLLVVQRGECCAGPRSIDLRPDAVGRLELDGRVTSFVRATSRVRLMLDPCLGRWPLRGLVELAWGDEPAVERLAPSAALAVLARHRRVIGLGAELDQLLELAGRPLLRLTRPPRWDAQAESVAVLLDAIGGVT